jgi:hypothetical protein
MYPPSLPPEELPPLPPEEPPEPPPLLEELKPVEGDVEHAAM